MTHEDVPHKLIYKPERSEWPAASHNGAWVREPRQGDGAGPAVTGNVSRDADSGERF